MKIDLQSLLGGKAAAPRQKLSKKGAEPNEFAAELEPRLASTPRAQANVKPDQRREKKDRPSAELLAHALLVPPALPRIDTNQAKLKAAPPEAAAVSTRAKATTHELAVPGEAKAHAAVSKKARPVDETTKAELAPTQKPEPTVAATKSEATTAKFELPTVAAPKEAAPLAVVAPLMLEDPSVRAVLLPTVARVSLETAEAGRLNVQLKVNDGVAEIRASGPAAQLLESRQGELKVALAKEGLALGHFDLTQSHSQQRQQQPDGLDAPSTARRSARLQSTPSEGTQNANGHLHVKA